MASRKIEALLAELCVELGCCIPPKEAQRLVEDPPLNVDAFIAAVLKAEGCEDLRVARRLRERVATHFRRWEEDEMRDELIDELSRYAPKDTDLGT